LSHLSSSRKWTYCQLDDVANHDPEGRFMMQVRQLIASENPNGARM